MGLSLMQEDMLLQYGPRGDRKPASFSLAGVSRLGMAATTATRIAVLSVGSQGGNNSVLDACVQKLQQHCQLSQMQARYLMAEPRKRGDSLIAVGSPFGALSPLHFQNSMSVGIVSNLWPPTRHPASLLMADLRCLPGEHYHGLPLLVMLTPYSSRPMYFLWVWQALMPFCGFWGGSISSRNFFTRLCLLLLGFCNVTILDIS
jgi:hypothetical protein